MTIREIMPSTVDDVRLQFFDLLFGDEEGYICIAHHHKAKPKSELKRSFFEWPTQRSEVAAFITQKSVANDVWFATCLFDRSRALKEYAIRTRIVPADLDTCDPETVTPNPPVVLQTSPGRWQAMWLLDDFVDPEIASDYAKRIAYKYQDEGADTGGWDIGQLLRVPYTTNFKKDYGQPEVELERVMDLPVPASIFEEMPVPVPVNGDVPLTQSPIPDELPDAELVIKRHWQNITEQTAFTDLHEEVPDEDADWSKMMWRLINMCFEAGMTVAETFVVARTAKCNKYVRDNRPERYLWHEVQKASAKHQRVSKIVNKIEEFNMPLIVDPHDEPTETFIDKYMEFGVEATDAPEQFHTMSALMVMSAMMSANLKVEVTHGRIRPHLWGLVLGESTLTRKTTAMRLGMEMVVEVDEQLMLASEGSVEGILSALQNRNGKVSIIFRDEVGGMFAQMERTNYLAGSREVFTNLYDAPAFYKRKLRKETVTVVDPIFMMYNGGVREQVYAVLDDTSITSGFLPRYLIVSGDSDPAHIRPTGPPKAMSNFREEVMRDVHHMYNTYNRMGKVKFTKDDHAEIEAPIVVDAQLTDNAWTEYQRVESVLTKSAYKSHISNLALPMFGRLATSILKIGVLIAASRQEPTSDNQITVERRDIVSATRYGQEFGMHAVDAMLNVGKPINERILVKIMRSIERNPGVSRSDLMRFNHLHKREADDILGTLVDRGMVYTNKNGRATYYHPND